MAASSLPTLLLVDGYNIIGAWSSLQKIRDHHGLESARRELVESLINYTAHQGCETQIVFDAQYQKTPVHKETHTPNLSVHYTGFAQTADTYIEKICASFFHQSSYLTPRLIVATSDYAQRTTIIGYGAEWMSAQKLVNEVEKTMIQLRKQHRPKKQAQGRFLLNSLDAKAQEQLQRWRQGMY